MSDDPRIQQLVNGVVPAIASADLPSPTAPVVVYVPDATAGQRFKGFDVTANAWVNLG